MDNAKVTRKYWGLLFDDYTPQVEAQILRDCMGLIDVARNHYDELVIVCEDERPSRMLSAIGLRVVPLPHLAKSWNVYKTKEDWPTAPEWATTIWERDLWQKQAEPKLRVKDPEHSNGYYLPPRDKWAA